MRKLVHVLAFAMLLTFAASTLLPFLWMAFTSLCSRHADGMNFGQIWWDIVHSGPKPANYREVLCDLGFARALFNSAFVTVAVTVGLVLNSSLAAFAFARLSFFGRDHIFFGYLATMMVPSAITMIPTFALLRWLHCTDTYWALIVPPMFSAYGVFMLRQFFLALPRELEEAAVLDGCSTLGIYWRILMPLSTPALAALSILTFLGTWRSFMWPLIVTYSKDMFTLPLALAQFQEMYGVQWVLLMAGSMIMILPMLTVFLLGQRFFVEGIQLGAVKG